MIKINVISNNSEWNTYFKNPSSYIDKKIKKIRFSGKNLKKKNIFCTLVLSGTNEIKKLNKKFRKKNKSTDVLSFPFYSKKDLKKKLNNDKEVYLGDIIINLRKIKYRNNHNRFRIEFNKLFIHGLTHLLGYNHKNLKDYAEMKKVEMKFLSYFN